MAIAGRVAIVPKGEWSKDVTYDKLDLVTHNGNTFIAYKSSVGVEPVDGDTWMLVMQGIDPQDIENIINGTTTVGNAKKLNGLADTDFQKTVAVNAQTNTLASLFDLVPNSGKVRFMYLNGTPSDFPTNLGTPTANGYLSVEVNKIGAIGYYNINAVYASGKPFNITGYYTGSVFYWNNNADGGNADTVDGFHASDFLPKTGGEVYDGKTPYPLSIRGVGTSAYMKFLNSTKEVLGYLGMYGADNPMFVSSDGATMRNILHTGNKPTGTYTGNGSATERVIETGGIGTMLYLRTTGYSAIVFEAGALVFKSDGTASNSPYQQTTFKNGKLTLKTNGILNESGTIFTYTVI